MKGLAEEIHLSSGWLAGGLHDQDHTWAEDGDVAVVALESGHCSLVGGRDGVERLTVLDPVANNASFFGIGIFVIGPGRIGGALVAHARLSLCAVLGSLRTRGHDLRLVCCW
jgi:hypothetical protein